MNKLWYESKAVWGMIGFAVFGILNTIWPSVALDTLIIASLGWAGYGMRSALK